MIRAGRLAIVLIENKTYYEDVRMAEYRNINDFSDRILFTDMGGRKIRRLEERIEFGSPEWDAYTKRIQGMEDRTETIKKSKKSKRSRL